ncbi:MAG: hypothetical protein Q7V57_00340 [Actinomycetota bacterium]|nr:hypothetical protein [Actinomycetota bacterium]
MQETKAHWPRQAVGDEAGVPAGRATPLLVHRTLPLSDLLLDPGNELDPAHEHTGTADASFVRAFAPMRAYQRLLASGLDGLRSKIMKYPASIERRVLVREYLDGQHHVVIDGSWYVATLRYLADAGPMHGEVLPAEVEALFDDCPVTVVPPDTDPALVLALLADPVHHQAADRYADHWMQGQRDRLLRELLASGTHHSKDAVLEALGGDRHAMRRYQAYHALQQLMQQHHVELHEAIDLYPLFHAAVGRQAIRTWLDWDDSLWCFLDDVALEHFHRLLTPQPTTDGSAPRACIRTVDDVVHLCDVLGEPDALRMITDEGRSLKEAVAVINDGAFQQWTTQVSSAIGTMQWDRRRFEGNRR